MELKGISKNKNLQIISRSYNVFLSSLESNGATNLNAYKNQFTVNFGEGINFPKNTINLWVSVPEVTVWYNTPNISADKSNNKLYFEYDAKDYEITFDDGLYSVENLNSTLESSLINLSVPGDLFTFEADKATQKIYIHYLYATTQIDFTQPNSIRGILGFDSRLSPLAGLTTGEYYDEADNVAAFNQVNYYLIKSDIVSKGIRVNSNYNKIISKVLIDVSPGSQIVMRKENPEKIYSLELINQYIRSITVALVDQNGNNVDTLGDEFSVSLEFNYDMLVDLDAINV